MRSLPQAVSLSRALLALSRARRSGVLYIASELGQCEMVVVEGTPRAALGELAGLRSLGDELLFTGELDAAAHHRALARAPRGEARLAGDWLVAQGLVTRGAVQAALRRQLRDRLCALLCCESLDYRFGTNAEESARAPIIEEPLSAADLVLSAMRRVLLSYPLAELSRVIEPGPLGLSSLGEQLLAGAALWPEEAAALTLLREGKELSALLRVARGSERVVRALAMWSLLGAVVPLRARAGGYTLLLRKSRQIRRAAGARTLLDLKHEAPPEAARRALRSLATRVHPDGLGPDARPEIRRTCNEVMAALLEAEQRLARRA